MKIKKKKTFDYLEALISDLKTSPSPEGELSRVLRQSFLLRELVESYYFSSSNPQSFSSASSGVEATSDSLLSKEEYIQLRKELIRFGSQLEMNYSIEEETAYVDEHDNFSTTREQS